MAWLEFLYVCRSEYRDSKRSAIVRSFAASNRMTRFGNECLNMSRTTRFFVYVIEDPPRDASSFAICPFSMKREREEVVVA